jgi:hypothetical protein
MDFQYPDELPIGSHVHNEYLVVNKVPHHGEYK